MAKTLNFKSKTSYRKWLAYDKMNVKPRRGRVKPRVLIAGRPHHVKRSRRAI